MNIKLRLKIIQHFVNQANFATAMGVDDAFVSRVIRKRKTLPIDKQIEWAKSLGCSVNEIFPGGGICEK